MQKAVSSTSTITVFIFRLLRPRRICLILKFLESPTPFSKLRTNEVKVSHLSKQRYFQTEA